jgi:glycerol uptake facilitator-like aquaporin
MSMNKYGAEFIGTFWLVLGGCGSAVLAAAFPNLGIGLLGVSLAFGLTLLTMAYAIGHISGCHLNPAVSFGLWPGGRFPANQLPQGFAPLAIGLGLTLIHLISIPVTNTSVNPARSTGVGVFVGGWAVAQLWLFWVAPIAGGLLGAAIYRVIGSPED